MRVLVTGHDGYIGQVLVPLFRAAGHEVDGPGQPAVRWLLVRPGGAGADALLRLDVRDVQPAHLEGFDAVVHLAAISNDPLGDLNPDCTYDINHRATATLAAAAKDAGRVTASSTPRRARCTAPTATTS